MNIFGIQTLHSSGQRSQMLFLRPAGAVPGSVVFNPHVHSSCSLKSCFFPVYSCPFCCRWWLPDLSLQTSCLTLGSPALVFQSASGSSTGSKCGCCLPPLEACPTLTLGVSRTKLGTDVLVHYISYLVLTFYARLACDRSRVLLLLYSELVSCPATIRASVLLFSPAFFSHWLDFQTSATSSV